MRRTTQELERFLAELARSARDGDRLPTVRELMRRFGASQAVVQRAFEQLKSRGLIDAQVGRGTFFRANGAAASDAGAPVAAFVQGSRATPAGTRSVLLLRRSISIARGRALAEGLLRRFSADGHRVLELSYTDPDHALAVLRGLPRFDACVVQSTYRTIPIALLAALKERSEVLAIDGASVVGADVEAVGTEWGEPLAAAVSLLQQSGHRRIALAITALPFLAAQLGRRRFDAMRHTQPELHLREIALPLSPDEDYAEALLRELAAMRADGGKLPFTGLVAWGIEDGAGFRRELAALGLDVPSRLSVVLLGRTDLANEHDGFFHVVGTSVEDQVGALHAAIRRRWDSPQSPYGVSLTPVTARAGLSVSPPAADGPIKAPRAAARRSRS